MNHSELYEGLAAANGALVVLRQPPRSVQPTEGSFHNPALRLNHESFLVFGSGYDFQGPEPADPRPRDDCPVRRVHPDDFRELDLPTKLGERCFSSFGVLHGSGGNHQRPDQAERVNYDVSLTAGDFFSPRRSPSA